MGEARGSERSLARELRARGCKVSHLIHLTVADSFAKTKNSRPATAGVFSALARGDNNSAAGIGYHTTVEFP
ncbi:hypothetical protein D3C81_1731470 [compost metagenome]